MANFLRGGARIYGARKQGIEEGVAAPDDSSDNCLSALLKLIPAEIISIYMAIRDSATEHHSLAVWFLLCLGACILLRGYASLPRSGPARLGDVQARNVIVSAIAFLLWAYAIGPTRPIEAIPLDQWFASARAALFGIVAPLLVPTDTGGAIQ